MEIYCFHPACTDWKLVEVSVVSVPNHGGQSGLNIAW